MNFKVKEEGVEKTGYLKISSEGKVYMFYSDEEKILDPAVQIDVTVRGIHFLNIESFSRWVERHDFEIVPRDPETYTDWKAGDEVIDNAGDAICIIIVRLGELVFIKNPDDKIKTITSAWVDANYKLIVTDYEQEIAEHKRLIGSIEERMTKLISKPASLDSIAPYWDEERKGVVIPLIGKVLHAKCLGKADWEGAKKLAEKAGGELFSKKEGYILAYYKDEINELLEAHGGDKLEGWNWCSSEYSELGAWCVNFFDDGIYPNGKCYTSYVRAVSAL